AAWRRRDGAQHPPRYQGGRGDGLERTANDDRGRPVVARQVGGRGPRVVRAETQEEAHIRAAEAVDGLVGVADDGEPRAVAAQQAEQRVLAGIDVLIFVNAYQPPAFAQRFGQRRLTAQQRRRQLDQAVEVDEVAAGQGPAELGPALRIGRRGRQQL